MQLRSFVFALILLTSAATLLLSVVIVPSTVRFLITPSLPSVPNSALPASPRIV